MSQQEATTQQEIANTIETLLMDNFSIEAHQFDWETSLDDLDEKFELLSYLIFLEQLLQDKFSKKIPLLENINTALHTPKDILQLTINTL